MSKTIKASENRTEKSGLEEIDDFNTSHLELFLALWPQLPPQVTALATIDI